MSFNAAASPASSRSPYTRRVATPGGGSKRDSREVLSAAHTGMPSKRAADRAVSMPSAIPSTLPAAISCTAQPERPVIGPKSLRGSWP